MEKCKLLIAEDVATVREALCKMIDWPSLGVDLTGAAESGEEALELMERNVPDILLTDIGMPKTNGLELIASVTEKYPNVKCVILSGLNEFEHARQAIRLKVHDYILKPIDPEEIQHTIGRIAEQLKRERSKQEELRAAEQKVRERLPILSERLPDLAISGNVKKSKLVEQALSTMIAGFRSRDFSLADVAANVGLSEKYLNQLFKEATGVTVYACLIRLRMDEAAELLKEPYAKVYEVCDRIGYADQDHFRESFKKQFGVTPTEYRNRFL
ncbi:helix-turn-helix domain-containing protein [Cohnella faecalis]|uniref:Response regulator n=1 Tax=Cohnella faecalis TaxID=2315694 RepID=A0A398CZA0_9BACL|nr:helix-turn-helix domain-containing protein [Cohnella faecalis]RIE04551.1 response regulator [Cohnella faecalis]